MEDLTGGGDHFRAEIVSDRFGGPLADPAAQARLRRFRRGYRRPDPRALHQDFDPGRDRMTNDEIRDFIDNAIEENQVMLFMKGTPNQPACGFSARTVGRAERARRASTRRSTSCPTRASARSSPSSRAGRRSRSSSWRASWSAAATSSWRCSSRASWRRSSASSSRRKQRAERPSRQSAPGADRAREQPELGPRLPARAGRLRLARAAACRAPRTAGRAACSAPSPAATASASAPRP